MKFGVEINRHAKNPLLKKVVKRVLRMPGLKGFQLGPVLFWWKKK